MTEKYRTLENTIRDHARKITIEKAEANRLRFLANGGVVTKTKPEPLKEEVLDENNSKGAHEADMLRKHHHSKYDALKDSGNVHDEEIAHHHLMAASHFLRARELFVKKDPSANDHIDIAKEHANKAESAEVNRLKKEEIEPIEELTGKGKLDDLHKYHEARGLKGRPNSKYHAVMRVRAERMKNMRDKTGPNRPAVSTASGRKTLLQYAAQDSKTAKSMKPKNEDMINELSKKVLGSYIKKTSKVLPSKEMEVDDIYKHEWDRNRSERLRKDVSNRETKIKNHHQGIERAVGRLTKEEMTDQERDAAIAAHQAAHEKKVQKKKDQLVYRQNRNKQRGLDATIKSLKKEDVNSIDTSAKLDGQRKRLQAQKDAMRQNLMKQKQAKAAQDAKDRAMEQDELKKAQLKEVHVHNYERASKLQALHNRLYNRLSAAGDMVKAEQHRKKAVEYKRIQYAAKDNPGKLPSV